MLCRVAWCLLAFDSTSCHVISCQMFVGLNPLSMMSNSCGCHFVTLLPPSLSLRLPLSIWPLPHLWHMHLLSSATLILGPYCGHTKETPLYQRILTAWPLSFYNPAQVLLALILSCFPIVSSPPTFSVVTFLPSIFSLPPYSLFLLFFSDQFFFSSSHARPRRYLYLYNRFFFFYSSFLVPENDDISLDLKRSWTEGDRFRYFLIIQTDVNSSNNDCLFIGTDMLLTYCWLLLLIL